MGRTDNLYASLPVAGQHAAVTAFGYYWRWLRFGGAYAKHLSGYLGRERLSSAEWDAYQKEQLVRVLTVAASHVPYYSSTWTAAEKAAAAKGQLQDLPLLGKEPLRKDPDAFTRSDLRPRRPLRFHTSGSTGTPIASIWTADELRNSLALREARSARWAGTSFSRRRSTFSGRMVEPDPQSAGPFYRFNLAEKQVYLSAFHLGPETARAYVDALARHRVEWMTGYAVSYYTLAKFILEQKLSVPKLKALVTTSEKVTPGMRAVMEEAFGCRVFEEYSTVENAVFASECEEGSLHVSPDAGVVEILRPDGSPAEPAEPGEVVATCVMRDYQPLVRFRLGDLAAWAEGGCRCGREMPVLKEVV